jgi:hypothetical protein
MTHLLWDFTEAYHGIWEKFFVLEGGVGTSSSIAVGYRAKLRRK